MTRLEVLLLAEKGRLDQKREILQGQIAKAEEDLRSIGLRLRHIEGLLGTSDATEASPPAAAKSVGRSASDIAAEILAEREREPMHYQALAREVQSRGGDLSGKNPAYTLVARLVKDDRFVRPLQKGYYALRSDYPDAKNVGARRRSGNPG